MKKIQLLLLFIFLGLFGLFPEVIQAENILFIIGLGSPSHIMAMQPLVTNLAGRGHKMALLIPGKSDNDSRILHVNITAPYAKIRGRIVQEADQAVAQRLKSRHHDSSKLGTVWWDAMLHQSEAFLTDSDFVNFVNSSSFDLIVADFPIKEVAHVMAYKMAAKIVWFNTAGVLNAADEEMLGLPIESSWLPDFTVGSSYPWISDKLFYALNSIYWYATYQFYFVPKLDRLVAQGFGDNIPSVDDLIQRVDLVLTNERFPYAYPRSYPPFVLPVGGMHIKHSNITLPKDVLEFVEPVENFVLISFGSILNVNKLPKRLRQNIFDAVASFKNVRFLWKWNDYIPDDLPSNVLPMKWFPQQEVLAHPKCKGFVSQGGAMSFQEAIYHGVPMIVVPVWCDQSSMARSAVEHGVGIHLELSEITRESFQSALHDIIYNPSYANNAKLVAQRAQDQPMTSVDVAAWWIEYALRHNTDHLKSPAMKQRWWERRLLHIWFGLFSTSAFIILMLFKICTRCLMYFKTNFNCVNNCVKKEKSS